MDIGKILEDIRRGYKISGLKGCTGSFYRGWACCPLTAYALANGLELSHEDAVCERAIQVINKDYGQGWGESFWRGIDEIHAGIDNQEAYQAGREIYSILHKDGVL